MFYFLFMCRENAFSCSRCKDRTKNRQMKRIFPKWGGENPYIALETQKYSLNIIK